MALDRGRSERHCCHDPRNECGDWSCPQSWGAETIEAIETAQVVQKTWAERTAKDRSNVLRRKSIRFQVGQFDTTRDDMMMMAHGVVQEVWEQIQ